MGDPVYRVPCCATRTSDSLTGNPLLTRRLTVRLAPSGRTPLRRLILDSNGELPVDAALFEDIAEAPVHVFTRQDLNEGDIERLESTGAQVHPVPHDQNGLDLRAVLRVAREVGIESILCEGGARLAGSLLREGLVQRLYSIVAPVTLGSQGVPAFSEHAESLDWHDFSPAAAPQTLGRDTLIVLDRDELRLKDVAQGEEEG